MAFIQRANVILEVEDDTIEYYMARGYNQIDENGNILKEAVPTDVGALRLAYVSNKHAIEEKDAKILELQNEVNLLTAEIKALKKKQKQ